MTLIIYYQYKCMNLLYARNVLLLCLVFFPKPWILLWILSRRRTINGCWIGFFFPECGVWDGICLWLSSVAEERDHCRQPHQIPVLHGRLLVPHHPQLHRIRGQSFHIRKKKMRSNFLWQACYLRIQEVKYYLNSLILHYDDVFLC